MTLHARLTEGTCRPCRIQSALKETQRENPASPVTPLVAQPTASVRDHSMIDFRVDRTNLKTVCLESQPNCLSGLHRNYDDPKVSNLERSRERERNGISQRWSGACPLSEANATDKSGISATTSLGLLKHTATAGLEYMVRFRPPPLETISGGGAHLGAGNSGQPSSPQNMIDCRVGVHGSYPGGCGFESHRRNFKACRAVAQWQSTVKSLIHNFVGYSNTLDCRFGVHGK